MTQFYKNKFHEVLYLAVLTLSFIAFYVETDIYTPSFPEMVIYFGTTEDAIQMLLSMNFIGLCVSSLFFGPASDWYGRKPMLCLGLGVFFAGSVGCSLADSLSLMLVCRLLQGVGCGAIVSAGLTSLFDIYPPEKSSRLASFLNGTVSAMMALAPLIGNWVSIHMGWRVNFYLIALLAGLSFACTTLFIKETHCTSKRMPFNLRQLVANYASILCNRPFMAHTMIWCLSFSVVIVFISNLSLIFVDHLHVPKELFGYYQAAIMGAFFCGSMAGTYLIKRAGMLNTKIAGSALFLAGVMWLGLLSYVGSQSPLALVGAMAMASLGSSLAVTIYFSYSMVHVGEQLKGSAMSLTQSLRLLITSVMVGIAAHWFDGSAAPIAMLALLCTALCIAAYVYLYRRDLHIAICESASPCA